MIEALGVLETAEAVTEAAGECVPGAVRPMEGGMEMPQLKGQDASRDIRSPEAVRPLEHTLESPELRTDQKPLSPERRSELQDLLGWTDKQLDKCTEGEDGVIHYKTDNSVLEGTHGANGVSYARKTVEISGVKVEGVFPEFNSVFDVKLPENLERASNAEQFRFCNEKLYDAVMSKPDLNMRFNETQYDDILFRTTPEGYVWHHNECPGCMQLVRTEDHDRTQGGAAHTGGKALWGGGY